MKNPVKTITNKFNGGKTGLSQQSNSVRMAAVLCGPFIAVWIAVKLFIPLAWQDIATIIAFCGWIAWIIMMYAKAKSDAAGLIPFPQSHWRFPDGQQINYDLLVPPGGWEKITDYPDGSKLYRVQFKDPIEYYDADRAYPDIFKRALWKLPTEWNDSFKRTGHGEFFFANVFVDHPACESIEVSVLEWDEKESTRLPVCVITGCSYYYQETVEQGGKELAIRANTPKTQALEAVIKDQKHKIRELTARNKFLEEENEQYATEEPVDIKELADKRMEANRKRVGNIMDTKKSLLSRIINLKTFAIVFACIVVLLIVAKYIGFI